MADDDQTRDSDGPGQVLVMFTSPLSTMMNILGRAMASR